MSDCVDGVDLGTLLDDARANKSDLPLVKALLRILIAEIRVESRDAVYPIPRSAARTRRRTGLTEQLPIDGASDDIVGDGVEPELGAREHRECAGGVEHAQVRLRKRCAGLAWICGPRTSNGAAAAIVAGSSQPGVGASPGISPTRSCWPWRPWTGTWTL